MKANELRIGNYVKIDLKGSLEIKDEPITVSQIMDLLYNGEKSSFHYNPIPLTEDWFRNFSFLSVNLREKNYNTIYFLDVNEFRIEVHINTMTVFVEEKEVDCEFVHQLQNLHFALSNKELIKL